MILFRMCARARPSNRAESAVRDIYPSLQDELIFGRSLEDVGVATTPRAAQTIR